MMTHEQFQEHFQEKLERINRDKAMMRIYDQYEKTELDWISSMKGAKQEIAMQVYAEYKAESLLYGQSLQVAYKRNFAESVIQERVETIMDSF
ncbi:MAG: hypothetical protein LBI40_02080 [Treponema sp.]|jgi:hypothetical protein|nr:hypothetical protein [Treponema sp.]